MTNVPPRGRGATAAPPSGSRPPACGWTETAPYQRI